MSKPLTCLLLSLSLWSGVPAVAGTSAERTPAEVSDALREKLEWHDEARRVLSVPRPAPTEHDKPSGRDRTALRTHP